MLGFAALGVKAQEPAGRAHARYAEAVEFAAKWRDLVDDGKHEEAFLDLAPTFQRNLTSATWKQVVERTRVQLGARQSRTLRRVVWYENPPNAPLPGLYAAVEFDSVFENARNHFQYIILHSQDGAPFKVMRNEATFALDKPAVDRSK